MSIRIIIVALVIMMGLSACGQKGPLYLPDSPPDKDTADNHAS